MDFELKKTCDICKFSANITNDVFILGDWMVHQDLTVHYFCLLLSTYLPQNGKDASGILGFLARDIRKEIQSCAKRDCCYCGKPNASVRCYDCKDFFHVKCGYYNQALFHFTEDFRSYCDNCVVLSAKQNEFSKNPQITRDRNCAICRDKMGFYHPTKWVYGECCGNGFAHTICMRKYALRAGYYLKCIWCKDKEFREHVRRQSVFVPDRDADWEREQNAYRDLHRGHARCDMSECHCPRGRDYNFGKWRLIRCSLCGSFGAHNPICITGSLNSKEKITDFKCDTCLSIERAIPTDSPKTNKIGMLGSLDTSLYIHKINDEPSQISLHETPSFSIKDMVTQTPSQENIHSSELNAIGEDTHMSSPALTILSPNTEPVLDHNYSTIDLCTELAPNDDNIDTENSCPKEASDDDIVDAIFAEVLNDPDFKNYIESYTDTHNENNKHFITFGAFEFNAEESECLGQCKVRIDTTHPRFAGKTIEEIMTARSLLSADDVIERTNDKGPFTIIDDLIAKYK